MCPRSPTVTLPRKSVLFPISLHDFLGPVGLFDVAARTKARHHWLDIHNGGPIDSIQPLNTQIKAGNLGNPANRHANPVWPIAPALRKDTDLRPIRSATRVTGVVRNIFRSHLIKHEDDLGMTKLVQAKQSFGIELIRIQFYLGAATFPVIILRQVAAAANVADCLDLKYITRFSSGTASKGAGCAEEMSRRAQRNTRITSNRRF
jgi:hypothetical protein